MLVTTCLRAHLKLISCNLMQSMDINVYPFAYQPVHHGSTFNQYHPFLSASNIWSSELAKFRYEKEILENGLANCVTYLHALRKRQIRDAKLLSTSPALPRKKRKKIQHNKRELEKEIKNKEREELALLNNLQACKTNIYIAKGFRVTYLETTVPDLTSSATQCSYADSEPTEISWNGWTDDAVVSPFEKHRKNPFNLDEIAPDEHTLEPEHGVMILRTLERRSSVELEGLPAPPNTAQSHYLHSSLSPTAMMFDPQTLYAHGTVDSLKRFDTSTTTRSLNSGSSRRFTEAGISPLLRNLTIQTRPDPEVGKSHTWCDNTPQRSPRKNDDSHKNERVRRMSM